MFEWEARFWAKVDAEGDCWLWTASTNPQGYGQFTTHEANRGAHRIAWELLVGPIPEGLQLDHLCRVPRCVNPAHLQPVTQAENMRRGVHWRGTDHHLGAKTHCPKGHPYSGDNLYVAGHSRMCRTCRSASSKRLYPSRREYYQQRYLARRAAAAA